jgi:hypothetical protein
MRRGAAKTDANQYDIVRALTRAGCSVESLHRVGAGVPDLLVGIGGRNYLLEVKSPKGRLNALQRGWHRRWCGQTAVVRDWREALRCVALMHNG